jgi:raffinose/stachyose/melibiose transport system permease protein
VLPLVRPAMATVAVFTMIPIWNDLWFPLILAPSEEVKTITLGAQVFIGQFVTNWNAVLWPRCRWPSCRCWSSTSSSRAS